MLGDSFQKDLWHAVGALANYQATNTKHKADKCCKQLVTQGALWQSYRSMHIARWPISLTILGRLCMFIQVCQIWNL